MKLNKYINFLIATLPLALFSCSQDELMPTEQSEWIGPAVMDVTLNDPQTIKTRHTVDNTTDHWTTKSFSAGDRIGLFSTGGLVGEDGESQWMLNEHMDYDQATGSSNYRFRNDELILNTGMMGSKVGKYVYFPYTDKMPKPDPNSHETPNADGNYYHRSAPSDEFPGLWLRKEVDGVQRCIDYMYINNISITNGALGGGFYHGFAEMIIVRGEGFDEPKNEVGDRDDSIWIVLSAGYTHIRINAYMTNSTGAYTFYPQIYHRENDEGLSQEDAKKWQAWKGEDYMDSKDGEPWPREAYYCILPSAHGVTNPAVNYIELYNNDGKKCQVSNFELNFNETTGLSNKNMVNGQRYAVEVLMVEQGATVRPHKIEPWIEENLDEEGNNLNDITDIRTVGINTYDDLSNWSRDYNDFIKREANRPQNAEDAANSALAKYGDYDLDNKRWMFYISDNIVLPSSKANVGVDELQDLLEGASKVNNFTISNLKFNFIGKITGQGELRNLAFNNLYVKPASSEYEDGVAGAIVNEMDGGTLTNIIINDGTMIGNSSGTIGMLCGTVSGNAKISDCKVSGAMIGSTWGDGNYPEGVFGKVAEDASPQVTNIETTGLILKSN